MPLFFFHVVGDAPVRDERGTELIDHDAARDEAARLAGGLLTDDPMIIWGERDWGLAVTDEHGLTLYTINVLALSSAAVDTDATQLRTGTR